MCLSASDPHRAGWLAYMPHCLRSSNQLTTIEDTVLEFPSLQVRCTRVVVRGAFTFHPCSTQSRAFALCAGLREVSKRRY